MGEQFNLYTQMVTMPDGEVFIVEAQRPKLGSGDSLVFVRSLAGLPRWREVLDHHADLDARVTEIANGLRDGRWPASA